MGGVLRGRAYKSTLSVSSTGAEAQGSLCFKSETRVVKKSPSCAERGHFIEVDPSGMIHWTFFLLFYFIYCSILVF